MSYVLKPTKMKFKDPISGNYVNINAVSSDAAKSVIEGWLRSNPGELVVTPLRAATAAAMTNTAAIYIYTGSQAGYTYGNWYYHDGTTWVSGGPYSPVEIDASLTSAGAAADAKATNDKIADLKSAFVDITVEFATGGVDVNSGAIGSTNQKRLHSVYEIPVETVLIELPSGISGAIFAWRYGDTYLGCFNGVSLSKNNITFNSNSINITDVRSIIKHLTDYDVRLILVLKKDDDSTISASDATNVKLYTGRNSVLSFDFKTFEYGRIDKSDGDLLTDTTTQISSVGFLPKSFKMECPSGYLIDYICVYQLNGTFLRYYSVNQAIYTTPSTDDVKYKIVVKRYDGQNIDIESIKNSVSYDVLTKTINELKNTIDFKNIDLEYGGIDTEGVEGNKGNKTRIRTIQYFSGDKYGELPSGYRVYRVFYYNESDLCFNRYKVGTEHNTFKIDDVPGCVYKIVISTTDTNGVVDINAIQPNRQKKYYQTKFDTDYDVKEFSSITNDFDLTPTGYQHNMMQQVYDAFDDLITDYPTIINKTDAAMLANLSYPNYADYTTWMYTINYNNVNASHEKYCIKPKVLIIAGLHGSETTAPLNTFIFAKRLIEDGTSNSNLFKLLTGFTFYIIPCVNGYGMKHYIRTNGNGVDINRNFPTHNWEKNGQQGDPNYSGETALSEFETNLIVNITNYIEPDVVIDHHNYDHASEQFYMGTKYEFIPITYKLLTDCSYAFCKKYPSFFGAIPKLFVDTTDTGAPYKFVSSTLSGCLKWWNENTSAKAAVIEVSNRINYLDGVVHNNIEEINSVKSLAVAQYTLIKCLIGIIELLFE